LQKLIRAFVSGSLFGEKPLNLSEQGTSVPGTQVLISQLPSSKFLFKSIPLAFAFQ